MGGSGTPDPDQEVGYVPNVSSYYIFPNSACQPDNCTLKSIVTPEEAWPLYGGLTARTWKQSILDGVEIYDAAVRAQLPTADTNVVLFGYSQSGAILAIEKRALADDPTIPQAQKDKLQIVVIGNVSRPNGGLNGRLPGVTIPIIEFPFGPTMPTDTGIETTDVALKWDIIADAPLYLTNGLALLNAFIGGPGFGIVHGTYPNPENVPPTGLVGGYTQPEWQAIMDDPQWFADNYPDLVTVQPRGAGSDTTYITVTPKVLPLVVPLHSLGLGFVADLIEPALREIIEETGYDRSIPYGQPTPFRLFPVFDPIKLTLDVIAAIPQGIQQALNGGPPPLVGPNGPITDSSTVSSFESQALAGAPTTGVDPLSKKSTPPHDPDPGHRTTSCTRRTRKSRTSRRYPVGRRKPTRTSPRRRLRLIRPRRSPTNRTLRSLTRRTTSRRKMSGRPTTRRPTTRRPTTRRPTTRRPTTRRPTTRRPRTTGRRPATTRRRSTTRRRTIPIRGTPTRPTPRPDA